MGGQQWAERREGKQKRKNKTKKSRKNSRKVKTNGWAKVRYDERRKKKKN